MNEVMTKGLEGALRAAVDSGSSGGPKNGSSVPNDLMGLAVKLLPKLLENAEERENLVELQKEGVSALRKEMLLVRRQLRELVQSHKGILEELCLLRELQSTMVAHLARVQILELPDDEEDIYDDELSDELDYAEELQAARPRRRAATSQAPKNNARRKPR